jgi:hypothetical protein
MNISEHNHAGHGQNVSLAMLERFQPAPAFPQFFHVGPNEQPFFKMKNAVATCTSKIKTVKMFNCFMSYQWLVTRNSVGPLQNMADLPSSGTNIPAYPFSVTKTLKVQFCTRAGPPQFKYTRQTTQ